MVLKNIKGRARCIRILFEKGDFTIALFQTLDSNEEMPPSTFSMKGVMAVKLDREYQVEATLDEKTKYNESYNLVGIKGNYDLQSGKREDVFQFLTAITSGNRANALLDEINNIQEVLENQDIDALIKVKGIGVSTAEKLISGYFAEKDFSEAYIELAKYGLTQKAIRSVCVHFKSAEIAVKKVDENPYVLMKVSGFGFTKADTAFLNNPENKPSDKRRVIAYIEFMIENLENEGHTWIGAKQFVSKLREFIPDADLEFAIKYVKNSNNYIVEPFESSYRVTSKELYNLENDIALEISRIVDANCTMDLGDYERSIKLTEKSNGWEYNKEQREAIDGMVKNNVFMLQGFGGTGKTSAVTGFLNAVEASGYSYSQCALSGKAADNLSQVTGKQGYTIHSLLGAGQGENGDFSFNEKKQLPSNVVVLDELSMVNARIFLSLLKAIRSGSKLIMIGDFGQLEAIGVGVMGGMIRSKSTPMTLLKKINRQAQDSAIITHSISVRRGHVPEGLSLEPNTEKMYGEKKDLKYIFVNNKNEADIFDKTIAEFESAIKKYDISDVQILCSTKTSGSVSTYKLNQHAQEIYNPYKSGDKQIDLGYGDYAYSLREGDKVINMKNSKSTLSPEGNPRPIYNGNTGVVIKVTNDNIVVHFDGIGEVLIEGSAIENIQLGYAITVHKSQGSTIKCVILALPFHFLLNTRELAYTGITRASEYQVIVTSPRSFKRALEKTDVRQKQIMLHEFLIKLINKQEAA